MSIGHLQVLGQPLQHMASWAGEPHRQSDLPVLVVHLAHTIIVGRSVLAIMGLRGPAEHQARKQVPVQGYLVNEPEA